MTAEFSINS